MKIKHMFAGHGEGEASAEEPPSLVWKSYSILASEILKDVALTLLSLLPDSMVSLTG